MGKPIIKVRKAKQSPQWHIGIEGTLMLIESHYLIQKKGNIILYPHVNYIIQRGNFQCVRIRIISPV